MKVYTVGIAGQVVTLLFKYSGGLTPSAFTNTILLTLYDVSPK